MTQFGKESKPPVARQEGGTASADEVAPRSDVPGTRRAQLAAQRVMQSPVYLLLAGMPGMQALLQEKRVPLAILSAVSEQRWLNLLQPNVIEDLAAGRQKLSHVLAALPKWRLEEVHVEALREPQVRQLIQAGIFSFDRFMRLNGRQLKALVASADLRSQLLSRKMTAPFFLRQSPSQLADLVAALDAPKAAL